MPVAEAGSSQRMLSTIMSSNQREYSPTRLSRPVRTAPRRADEEVAYCCCLLGGRIGVGVADSKDSRPRTRWWMTMGKGERSEIVFAERVPTMGTELEERWQMRDNV